MILLYDGTNGEGEGHRSMTADGFRPRRTTNGRVDQRSIRRANLSTVLRHVATDGPRSRATIALETGLNKTTVSSLVAELMGAELLVETGEDEQPGSVGRPARTVRLNGEAIAAVGLEVNVDYLAVCVTDLSGRVLQRRRVEADNAGTRPAPVLTRLARLARTAIAAAEGAGARVVGATLGLPGLVDLPGRTLVVAPNLGWRDVRAAEELSRRLDRPALAVRLDNEANLAALAEHWEGAARDLRTFVCVTGDVGIGAGVLVGGELFRGTHGFGGELGHIMVDPDGERCACGSRGCLETVAGQAAVLRRAGIAFDGPRPGLAAAELLARARAGDRPTLASLAEAGHALGVGLAAAVNLLDPEAVLLGGYLTPFSGWLAEPVRTEFSRRVLATNYNGCEIRPAALADEAAARGAAASVLRSVLADPTLVMALVPEAVRG
jgi:predicted NBD/HSP70 family sugar kinase